MTTEHENPSKDSSWLGIGAVLAAIGASVCCVGPLLLLSLGIGGAWMSTLTSMESIRPFFIILTLIFIAFGVSQALFDAELTIAKTVKRAQYPKFSTGNG